MCRSGLAGDRGHPGVAGEQAVQDVASVFAGGLDVAADGEAVGGGVVAVSRPEIFCWVLVGSSPNSLMFVRGPDGDVGGESQYVGPAADDAIQHRLGGDRLEAGPSSMKSSCYLVIRIRHCGLVPGELASVAPAWRMSRCYWQRG
jgi:hypothetical protein